MKLKLRTIALVIVALAGLAALPALLSHRVDAQTEEAKTEEVRAQESTGGEFTEAQKTALGPIIRDYILQNPEILFEAAEKQRAKEEAATMKKAEVNIQDNKTWLTDAQAPSAGNPKADITVVEFFDYNCGYCVRALPDIQAILKTDANVRFVFRELAILGPTSKTAALWALASQKQGKYFDFHTAIMNHKGPKEEAELEKLAKTVGLDVAQLKKDIASGAPEAALSKNEDVSRTIGVQGTPAFIVGETFIPGYIGEEGLKKAIAEERAKKTK